MWFSGTVILYYFIDSAPVSFLPFLSPVFLSFRPEGYFLLVCFFYYAGAIIYFYWSPLPSIEIRLPWNKHGGEYVHSLNLQSSPMRPFLPPLSVFINFFIERARGWYRAREVLFFCGGGGYMKIRKLIMNLQNYVEIIIVTPGKEWLPFNIIFSLFEV